MNNIGIGIIISTLITISIGIYSGRFVKGKTENFYVAGRKLAFPILGLALVAQAIDGNSTFANTTLSNDFGFWAGASLPIGLALSLFLLGKYFAPHLNHMKLLTLADFFRIKYDRRTEVIASLLMLFSFGILLAGNIAATAILLKLFFNIKYASAVILICFSALLYTLAGGLFSDVLTDIFQEGLLAIGLLLMGGYITLHYGFIDIVTSNIFFESTSMAQLLLPKNGALINWATIVALGFGNIIAIDFATRIFSAKSPDVAKKGCYFGAILTLALGIPFALLPTLIQWLGITSVEGVPLLATFANQILPPYISLFLFCGIISVSLSTIDGAILSMGNILAHNLLNIRKWLPEHDLESERRYLYISRIALIPIACIGMIFALLLPSPGVLLTVAFDIMFASLLVPFIGAFIIQKVYVKASMYAIVVGGVSRLIFATLTPTSFGVDNPWFYIPNTIIPPIFDGLGTILAPLLSLFVYAYITVRLGRKEVNAREMSRKNTRLYGA